MKYLLVLYIILAQTQGCAIDKQFLKEAFIAKMGAPRQSIGYNQQMIHGNGGCTPNYSTGGCL